MPKKVAPKLVDLGTTLYAVLSPGKGYLKGLYGSWYFHDNLPRASGCFTDKASADAALDRARIEAKAALDEKIANKAAETFGTTKAEREREEAFDWYIKRAQDDYDDASRAVVVELGFKPLGKWVAPPPPPPPKPRSGPRSLDVVNINSILGVDDDDDV